MENTVSKPANVALQQLTTSLRCNICSQFPKNTHICPSCSEMYCYSCVYRLMTAASHRKGSNKCGKCTAFLKLDQLIKLRCLETLDDISVDMARLSLNEASSSLSVGAGPSGAASCAPAASVDTAEFVGESQMIAVGRKEPVQGLPPAVQGTFTLRNVHQCRLPWVFSERVVDEMGFMWRMRVAPKEENQSMIGVFVEMIQGETGFFEIVLELTNICPKAHLIRAELDTESYAGKEGFLNKNLLPRGNINLNFRYTIRPASYRAKVLLQQRQIHKHTQQRETMKGNSDTFRYCINEFKYEHYLYDEAIRDYTDQLQSTWQIGVHGKHNFTEFLLILENGLPGIYEITLILSNRTPGSEKRLHYPKRSIQVNQKQLFNFGIRWDDLDTNGFVVGNDRVEIKVTIRPLQIDLKHVQQALADSDEDENSDDSDSEDYEYYDENDDNDGEHEYEESDSDDSDDENCGGYNYHG